MIVGHSLGALISLHYTLKHQDSIKALVLSGPALVVGEDTVATAQARFPFPLLKIIPQVPILKTRATIC